MTMPHLMNCPHSERGWCLDCVKELWEEFNEPSGEKLDNEAILELYGWEMLCELPLEIMLRNEPESQATGRAAEMILEILKEDYKSSGG